MIKIENLTVAFGDKKAVENETIEIRDGEILGMVGESGSGKSVSALTLMGLLSHEAKIRSGKILFDGKVLLDAPRQADEELLKSFRGERMTMVFQEPMTSLNPTWKIAKQVEEVLKLHTDLGKEERKRKVMEALASVGLKDVEKVCESYPHELSGGMRQRVMIAMAVILHPKLLIADEPTTALDVTIQNQIIALLREINEREKISMLFITHDLNLARRICHRIAVMKDGKVVEIGETEQIFKSPRDAYTQNLMDAVPSRCKKKSAEVQKGGLTAGQNGARDDSTDNQKEHPNILEVRQLDIYYRDSGNSLFHARKRHRVVQDISFEVRTGEVLGLVGESGCGKTTLSKAILGMNRYIDGEIRHFSKYPQMIFQDPYSSLNPSKTIGWLLQEPLRAMGELEQERKMTKADRIAAAHDMLKKVGMDDSYFDRKPSQLSGGQRQRVSIGQALITRPALVIADEPVSALDVTLQAQIMELMLRLKEELKLSYIFISHDINVIYRMSDRIMVMKDGKLVEIGDTEAIFHDPKEAYTKLLLAES